eukprot:jgi/Tetstr1/447375/TSEL_034812.t1
MKRDHRQISNSSWFPGGCAEHFLDGLTRDVGPYFYIELETGATEDSMKAMIDDAFCGYQTIATKDPVTVKIVGNISVPAVGAILELISRAAIAKTGKCFVGINLLVYPAPDIPPRELLELRADIRVACVMTEKDDMVHYCERRETGHVDSGVFEACGEHSPAWAF